MQNIEDIKKQLILIVDDIPTNLQVLGGILGRNNYIISAALNGEQALLKAAQLRPDLILLDVTMPGLTGYEVCEKLQESEETCEIPVIFLTAKTETEDIVQGFKVGAVDYLTKPFQTEELLTRVSTHIDLKNKKNELLKLNDELKQSQERYKSLYNSSRDSIIFFNLDYQIIDANKATFA